MTLRHHSIAPSHPGVHLREAVLPDLGLGKAEFARRINISRQHLYDILNGKQPITPKVAASLGKALGNGPGLWLKLQAAYDTWDAEQNFDVSHIETLEAAE